jgi:putative ABC transport system permease protein
MSAALPISYGGLIISLGFIVLAGVSSVALRLGLGRDLIWGTVRCVAQLFLMGFVLRFLFGLESAWPVWLVFAGMILLAAQIVSGRVGRSGAPVFWPTLVTMLLSYSVVSVVVTALIVQVRPWYKPQYFLPLGGMVIGNSMTAMALALERLLSGLDRNRAQVELFLSLGADRNEASRPFLREAIRAGMMPSIVSMMGVGVVFIPGMMTGQVLAGADPLVAVGYQIVVMLMLVGSTALGSVVSCLWLRRLCFTAAQQLRPGLRPGKRAT